MSVAEDAVTEPADTDPLTPRSAPAPATALEASLDDLHVCPRCHWDLVYPLEWTTVGRDHWRVSRRCPNCEWTVTGTHRQEVVDRFDLILDDATESLTRDLANLELVNMHAELIRLRAALAEDRILPEDF
jgi:hypothetical protein